MSAAGLTLENVRQVMREEIVAERAYTRQTIREEIVTERANTRKVVREEIVAERAHTQQLISGEIVNERHYTQELIRQAIEPVVQSVDNLRKMLEEDARAESARLTRVDRRSLKTQKLLTKHLSGHPAKAA